MPDLPDRLVTALAGRYNVLERIGAGGMATVYLAEDVRHERKVALKVLRPELAAVVGADRFLGEIKTTANLQHPHILPLHDSGEVDGVVFYVMPFVQGETLRDRLERERQLPVDDAVRIAREILGALDYAHRHGVIHRDIKPENILLHDGQALVADFGVALAVSTAGADGRMTETGMSLGTPSYMSPEQAMGEREITSRSDVYGVACVLYEMLIGEPPFGGPTPQAIVARVLTGEPAPMAAQRKTVPPHVEAAVLKALARLPADRFRSAADFADALGRTDRPVVVPAGARSASQSAASTASWRHPLVLGSLTVAATALVVAGWALTRAPETAATGLVEFQLVPSRDSRLSDALEPMAVSHDGSTIALLLQSGGRTAVYLRALGEVELRVVPGTEDATSVTFTADDDWITFSRGTSLYKVPLSGGEPTKVGDVPFNQATASYFPDGSIIIGSLSNLSIFGMESEGAELEELTQADPNRAERDHRRPSALPDGEHVLFDIEREDGRHPALLSLSTGEWSDLGLGVAQSSVYSAGHVVYAQGNRIVAVPVDLEAGRATGSPRVIDSVAMVGGDPPVIWALAASPGGTLVHASGPGSPTDLDLIWVDRDGTVTPTPSAPRRYDQPRMSPDATRVAVQMSLGTLDVYDLVTDRLNRLVTAITAELPVWSPDGQTIAFGDGGSGLWIVSADGSSQAERVLDQGLWPYSWAPDGRTIGAYGVNPGTARDIFLVHRQSDGTWVSEPFLTTSANERSPAISPTGDWIAYASDMSGRDEIYVARYPSGEERRLVSADGGREPAWSGDGRELFYRRGRGIHAVAVGGGPQLNATEPQLLFSVDASMTEGPTGERDWDVTEDGQRFLFTRSPRTVAAPALRVVTGFGSAGSPPAP